jgi:hypothetical protein
MERLAVRWAAVPTDPVAAVALARLAGQRAYPERRPAPDGHRTGGPATQPEQPIHGDYQDANLFFDRGRVSAVIDRDQIALAIPAWEVVRALELVFGFEPHRCRRFVDAYRTERALPLTDLDAAAAYDVNTCPACGSMRPCTWPVTGASPASCGRGTRSRSSRCPSGGRGYETRARPGAT